MALESGKKIKLLDEYIEFLKQELLFSMAESKPENITKHNIITIKRELDKAVQQKMRQCQIYYSTVSNNNNISLAAAGA